MILLKHQPFIHQAVIAHHKLVYYISQPYGELYDTAGYKQKAGLQYDMRRATDASNWLINEYPSSPPQTMG